MSRRKRRFEIDVTELHRREIDRDLEIAASARQSSMRVLSTHSPSAGISPAFSAMGMKSAGEIRHARGWCQRSNASTPTISPVRQEMIG